MSEVHELLLRIHDILDKAVSKQVGNSACILVHLFNSVSRQHHEVWASQFPFLHSLKEVIPPSEACLYGCINWSLAQAHSVCLSWSLPPKRIGCFWSGTFSLRWLRQLIAFGAFQRWTCWHLLILLNASIISLWKLHCLWGPWG